MDIPTAYEPPRKQRPTAVGSMPEAVGTFWFCGDLVPDGRQHSQISRELASKARSMSPRHLPKSIMPLASTGDESRCSASTTGSTTPASLPPNSPGVCESPGSALIGAADLQDGGMEGRGWNHSGSSVADRAGPGPRPCSCGRCIQNISEMLFSGSVETMPVATYFCLSRRILRIESDSKLKSRHHLGLPPTYPPIIGRGACWPLARPKARDELFTPNLPQHRGWHYHLRGNATDSRSPYEYMAETEADHVEPHHQPLQTQARLFWDTAARVALKNSQCLAMSKCLTTACRACFFHVEGGPSQATALLRCQEVETLPSSRNLCCRDPCSNLALPAWTPLCGASRTDGRSQLHRQYSWRQHTLSRISEMQYAMLHKACQQCTSAGGDGCEIPRGN